jgi:pimeloyl-ACP methyl ester carboxylesterase
MTEKPSLILVPGLLCSKDLWRDQITAFEKDYTIIVADHTLDDDMISIGRRLLDNAPDKFAIAGLSMGGYVALEVTRQSPERVTHLAVMDSRDIGDGAEERQRRLDFIKLVEQGSVFKGVTGNLMPMLIHPSRLQDEELTNRIYQMAEDVGKEGFIRQEKALLNRQTLTHILPTITCPTLILAGADDILIDVSIQRDMASKIPTADYVEIPDCGHLPTMEKPDAVIDIMKEWLAR